MMNETDQAQFEVLHIAICIIMLVSLCFITYIEWNTVRDSLIQDQQAAEYAYDYACSPSSQIVKRAEIGENVFISKTLWVNCGGLEVGEGNFVRPSHVEKKLPRVNTYGDDSEYSGLSVLREREYKGHDGRYLEYKII